jgi:hypothetical protein
MFLKLFIVTVFFLAVAFAGFAVKMFFIKGAYFKKQCSSSIKNPKTGKPLSCASGSCHSHSKLHEEIEISKKSPFSKRNIRIMTQSASE